LQHTATRESRVPDSCTDASTHTLLQNNQTPLDFAKRFNKVEVAQMLRELGDKQHTQRIERKGQGCIGFAARTQ
jgi:hypothetical protein